MRLKYPVKCKVPKLHIATLTVRPDTEVIDALLECIVI